MRPHRAYAEKLEPSITLSGREAKHLLEVLRAKAGDRLTVFDGTGLEARATVMEVGLGSLVLELGPIEPAPRETYQPITLYIALLKGDKLADIVRAVTELGVAQIVPFISQHCVVRELSEHKLERLSRIAIEAAKQCERSVVPKVLPAIPLKLIPAVEQGFVAQPRVAGLIKDQYSPELASAIATGPEGGLADNEVELLEQKGFRPISLGPRILRAETAPVALLSLLTAGEGQ